ncbi:putative acetyltransferase [uncultured Candidatus Thioglobus sp.]|nr:putative acetyltransferase [uncultured Candidatus Thioglobus sp.]
MPSQDFIIRKAKNADFLQISELDRVSWGNKSVNRYIPDGEHAWRLWVEYALVFCCFDDDKIIGVSLAFPTVKNLFAVHKIFVDKSYRNNGIGTTLFEKIIKEMDNSKQNSFLTVSPENDNAIKLYENMGYVFDEMVKGYYRKEEDRIVMIRRFSK